MKTFILIQLLLCLGLLYLLKPRNRRRRANPGHPARRFNDRVENCTTIEQPAMNPLTRHVRQLSDDQLRNALKSTRHAESYGKSPAGQRLLLALEEETNRRADLHHPAAPSSTKQQTDLCQTCARADIDCCIGAPGTAYCNEYRPVSAA